MNVELSPMLTIDRITHHLLVLSQDVDFARDIEATLRKEDYQATIVRNPRQAASAVVSHKDIDAIICDGQMNLGREEEKVFHQMRHNLEALGIPLLMLLDPDDDAQWQLADKLATDEFILKPTQQEELLIRLKGLWWRKDSDPRRWNGHAWPEPWQSFTRYVKADLEAKSDAGQSAGLALMEVVGAWDLMVMGDEMCDQLTDQLLDCLATNLRRIDRVVRCGRVTLIVYMPGRSATVARQALELLQAEFSEQTGLDFCLGLATYPDDGTGFTELVLSADRSLTQARAQATGNLTPQLRETDRRQAGAYKILIADDDPFMAALLRATFNALGYQPIVADKGRDAIELIHREQSDLVVVDHSMPELNGFELLEGLRASYGGRIPVPVIMLTIMTAQSDIIRGFELGVEDYIGKPFNPRELIARVERVLASRPLFLRTGS